MSRFPRTTDCARADPAFRLAPEHGSARTVPPTTGERTSSLSAGTNALLKLWRGSVARTADVLELFGITPAELSRAVLGTDARALPAVLEDGPLTADEIARVAGLEPAPLSASLLELELAGRVTLEDGVYRAAM